MTIGLSVQEITVWRPTRAIGGSGGSARTFAEISTGTPATVRRLSPGRAIRMFGVDNSSTWLGTVDKGVDIRQWDIVKITAGAFKDFYLSVDDIGDGDQVDGMRVVFSDSHEVPDAP